MALDWSEGSSHIKMQGQVEHMDTNSGMCVVAMGEWKFSSDRFNSFSEIGTKVISWDFVSA